MRDRLAVESEELAAAFRAAALARQERVALKMVESALAAQLPRIELPSDVASQQALLARLDASQDESDFRRARAVAAAALLRQGAYEDALYEAVHASPDQGGAVERALSLIR